MAEETERGAVIIGASRLDVGLERLLKSVMFHNPEGRDRLFDSDKALGTFSSRIDMCHRLGLIGDDFKSALTIVRRIRNDFAHSIDFAKLSEAPYSDRVGQLVHLTKEMGGYRLAAEALEGKTRSDEMYQYSCAVTAMVRMLDVSQQMGRPADAKLCCSFALFKALENH